MKQLKWSPTYTVNNSELDGHHKKIIELINLLDDSILREAVSPRFLKGIVDQLIEYTNYHFQSEEAFMKENGYPEYKEHAKEHQDFIKDVQVFQFEYDKGSKMLVDVIANYLKTWFIRHILSSDKKYSNYFKERGIEVVD